MHKFIYRRERNTHTHLTRVYFGLLHVLVSLIHSAASNKICIRMTVSTHTHTLTKAHKYTHLSSCISCEGGVLCQVKVRSNRALACAASNLMVCTVFTFARGTEFALCPCVLVYDTWCTMYAHRHGRSGLTASWGRGKRCASERQYHCSVCKTKLTTGRARGRKNE